MKKFLIGIIVFSFIVPNIVLAKSAPTLVKFWEDDNNEYYTYDYMKDALLLDDGKTPLAAALGDGRIKIEDVMSSLDGIYSKKRGKDALIIPSNFIKYSIRGEDNKLIDYYLYTEVIGENAKDKPLARICDENSTICFDIGSNKLILNDFKGENLYISTVDTDLDKKVDDITMIIRGDSEISSVSGRSALNITDNHLTIDHDPRFYITSESYKTLNIKSNSIGIKGSGKLSVNNILLNIDINIKTGTDDACGIDGEGLDVETKNSNIIIDLDLMDSEQSYDNINGAAISLKNSNVNINGNVSITSIIDGVLIENSDIKDFNVGENFMFGVKTSRNSEKVLDEHIALSLKNVKFNNKGVFAISDKINTKHHSVYFDNVDFINSNLFGIVSNSSKVALLAINSNLVINGKMFTVYNINDDNDNMANSMELHDSEITINKDLKKTPSNFETKSSQCSDGETCKNKVVYLDNKISAIETTDKLTKKEVILYPPEKVESLLSLNVYEEDYYKYEDDWWDNFKKNIGTSTILKIYDISISEVSLSIEDEPYNIVYPDGKYKIYVPIPNDTDKHEEINIYTLDYDKKSVSKKLEYTISEDGKNYIIEFSKDEIKSGVKFVILGETSGSNPNPNPNPGGEDPKEIYTCKYIDGKYYSTDGSIVDKSTYEKVCSISENPHTGVAVPIILFGILIGLGIFIYKTKRKDLFRKI